VHIAICIVGYRNADDVQECLNAIGTSSYEDFEVVVCENGGAAAYDALVRTVPPRLPGGQHIRLIQAEGNLGYAGGVNECISRSKGADAWWILNPDALPAPNALAFLIDELREGGAQLAGGVIHDEQGMVASYGGGRWRPWYARAEAIGWGHKLTDRVDRNQVLRSLSYVSGCCILVDRRYLTDVGAMREDYFLYGEEVEWCLRGLSLGMSIGFAPQARILHRGGSTTGYTADFRNRTKLAVFLDERNKVLLTRDRFPYRLVPVAFAALLIALFRYGRRGAGRQMWYAIQGWAAGVLNRRGPPALIDDPHSPTGHGRSDA
jgi:N-acetylglucosaminyl-diphospho-decaprenol L-rhamnosyltransferase